MQQPIRYYITKSGDEPTVRSVKVARVDERAPHRDEIVAGNTIDPSPDSTDRRSDVKRLVQGAIRKRVARI